MSQGIQYNLIQVADAVAREKNIERDEVLGAMEDAIQKIGKTKYGHENDIRAHIDPKSGDITLARYREVVEDVENTHTQIFLKEALTLKPDAVVGDFIVDVLPPVEFGRVAAQSARQIISQRVREVERMHQYMAYKDRMGEIVTGVVKRLEFGNYFLDMGRAEAILPKDHVIPREIFRPGDRVRAYILNVTREGRGPQIILSRTDPRFMAMLFHQEVPEIHEGLIEIMSVARDPGSRAKIAVRAKDTSLDPVGACVGIRGSRIQAIITELQGEKIDIVVWSESIPTYVINALAPAEISKVVLDEERAQVEVVVATDQLSMAIGRRGQNVKLATALTGLNINIISESEEAEKRAEKFKKQSKIFIEALDVDEVIAHLLTAEGFNTVQEVAEADLQELINIEGFDEDLATELQSRAQVHVDTVEKQLEEQIQSMGIEQDLKSLEGLTKEMLVELGTQGIKTLDEFADLASDELIDMLGQKMSLDQANNLILAARAHWFEGGQA